MSTPTNAAPTSPTAPPSQAKTSQEQASSHNPLPLPSPSDATDATKIDMSSGDSTVKLDHLGPLVVNRDGTLSRINNWAQMTEAERQNTLRVLGKRNRLRREALEGQESEAGK